MNKKREILRNKYFLNLKLNLVNNCSESTVNTHNLNFFLQCRKKFVSLTLNISEFDCYLVFLVNEKM